MIHGTSGGGDMTIKQRLKDYIGLSQEVIYLENKINMLREKQTSLNCGYGDGPKSTSCNDKISYMVADLVDMEEALKIKREKITKEKKEIEKMTEILTPIERLLIRARYIDGESLESVCGIIGYSWRQTNRIHGIALKKMEEQKLA